MGVWGKCPRSRGQPVQRLKLKHTSVARGGRKGGEMGNSQEVGSQGLCLPWKDLDFLLKEMASHLSCGDSEQRRGVV